MLLCFGRQIKNPDVNFCSRHGIVETTCDLQTLALRLIAGRTGEKSWVVLVTTCFHVVLVISWEKKRPP